MAILLPAVRAEAKSIVGDEAAFREADSAWKSCFSSLTRAPSFPSRPDPDNQGTTVDVRRTKSGFHIEGGSYSGSIEGGFIDLVVDFEPRGCRALWVQTDAWNGMLSTRVRTGWVNRGAPTDAEVRTRIGEPAQIDDPRHAFARSWLQHKCRGGPNSDLSWEHDIEGPIAPAQPWHDDLPQSSPFSYWSLAALDAIGARATLKWFAESDDEDPPLDDGTDWAGERVPDLKRPLPTFATPRFQLFEANIPGRNGGRAIALVDRAAKRHRWVVVTRGCVQGTTVKWLGAVGDRIVGVTHSRAYAQGDAILVIDAPTGTAWAVRLPESIREALEDDDRRTVKGSLTGAHLALWVARASAKIDLAPLLAVIPK